jgi:hypothetical protein
MISTKPGIVQSGRAVLRALVRLLAAYGLVGLLVVPAFTDRVVTTAYTLVVLALFARIVWEDGLD